MLEEENGDGHTPSIARSLGAPDKANARPRDGVDGSWTAFDASQGVASRRTVCRLGREAFQHCTDGPLKYARLLHGDAGDLIRIGAKWRDEGLGAIFMSPTSL